MSDVSKYFFYPNILLEGLVVEPFKAFVICVRCKVVLASFGHAAVGVAVKGHRVGVLVLVDETFVAVNVQRRRRGHGDEACGDGGLEWSGLGRRLCERGEVGVVGGAGQESALLHHHLTQLSNIDDTTANSFPRNSSDWREEILQ